MDGSSTGESFDALWQELDQERRARGWTRGKLARRTSQLSRRPCAEKTLHDRMSQGRRVSWDQVVWIVRALELDEQSWRKRWENAVVTRRDDRPDPAAGAEEQPDPEPAPAVPVSGARASSFILFGVAVAIAGLALGLFFSPIANFFAPSTAVPVRISNTSKKGVIFRLAPSPHAGASGGAAEGDRVTVVCQVRDGVPVTDTDDPQPEQPPDDTVWNKTDDGLYFSDLWSDLPKNRPSGLPDC
jgi:hypothetical protein